MGLKTGNKLAAVFAQGRGSGVSAGGPWWHEPSLRWLTTFLLLVFPFATLFVNRGDSYTLGLLTLTGVWVWIRSDARSWSNRGSAWLWIVFAVFFAIVVLSYTLGQQTDAGFRYLGRYLRFLLVVPVYLALRRYPPSVKTVFIGLAVGALISGVLALLKFLHAEGHIRVEATTDLSIIFGDLAATMVLCTVAGFGLMAASRRTWVVPLLALSLAGGVAATFLSGTRGAWIPFLFLLLALPTRLGGYLRGRYVALIAVVVIAVFGVSYLVPRTATHSRLGMISFQVHGYFASLSTVTPLADPSADHPRCLNTEAFLRAWVIAGRFAGGARAEASVVADGDLPQTVGPGYKCPADYAVRIRNLDHNKVAQYIFPRVPDKAASLQQTRLLARGAGVVTFAGGDDSNASINAAAYTPIRLNSRQASGDAINVFVAPGETAWLVPLESYFDEYSFAPANNNVGQRLEMWRAAWHQFLNHPLLGVGIGAYQTQTRKLISQRQIASFVGIYDHPHNDYFNMLASAGIIGFLALLAVLIVPFARFWRALRSKDPVAHAVGLAGALTVVGFAIYALTDTVFLHSMMITWYVIYMALFHALLDVQAHKSAKPQTSES